MASSHVVEVGWLRQRRGVCTSLAVWMLDKTGSSGFCASGKLAGKGLPASFFFANFVSNKLSDCPYEYRRLINRGFISQQSA